mmetsp:Transcript_36349/g.81952  ORF Transcript_36349/g.81952 Transcript_36349/m.81952 type:complete len:337 (+) Transcript_36349:2252-3262(+)
MQRMQTPFHVQRVDLHPDTRALLLDLLHPHRAGEVGSQQLLHADRLGRRDLRLLRPLQTFLGRLPGNCRYGLRGLPAVLMNLVALSASLPPAVPLLLLSHAPLQGLLSRELFAGGAERGLNLVHVGRDGSEGSPVPLSDGVLELLHRLLHLLHRCRLHLLQLAQLPRDIAAVRQHPQRLLPLSPDVLLSLSNRFRPTSGKIPRRESLREVPQLLPVRSRRLPELLRPLLLRRHSSKPEPRRRDFLGLKERPGALEAGEERMEVRASPPLVPQLHAELPRDDVGKTVDTLPVEVVGNFLLLDRSPARPFELVLLLDLLQNLDDGELGDEPGNYLRLM